MKLKNMWRSAFVFLIAVQLDAAMPSSQEIWRLYDQGAYKDALTKIYLAKSVVKNASIADLYFLEALIAFRSGYWAKVISIHSELEQRLMPSHAERVEESLISLKRTQFYFIHLTILAYESYRKYMFGDLESDMSIKAPIMTDKVKSDPLVTIHWPMVTDGSGRTEIWSDELDAFILNDLKTMKEKITGEPALFLKKLKDMIEKGLHVYDQSDLDRDYDYYRLKIHLLDTQWDLERPQKKKKIAEYLDAYTEIFKVDPAFELKPILLFRLGKLNFLLGNLKESESQLLSFIKIQGPSIWREVAHRYLGDIYVANGNTEKAIFHMKAALPKDQNLLHAYGVYRLGFVYVQNHQPKAAIPFLKQLLKTDWPKSDELAQWQMHLVQKLVPTMAESMTHPAQLKDTVGSHFYIETTFLLSDFEKNRKAYIQASVILKNLLSEALSFEQKIKLYRSLLDLALLQKNSTEVTKHCHVLVELYGHSNAKDLETVMVEATLDLDKNYLEKKQQKDFDAVKDISELYFNVFGQKGEFSPKMVKLSARYLNLWGIK